VPIITFHYDLPLEQTMAFEALYSEGERLDLVEKQQMRDTRGSIFVWMHADGELAGETYGTPLEHSSPGLEDLSEPERKAAIHCYSNSVLPAFQHQGLGTILKAHWLGIAAATGFKTVYGYARPGASQKLNASFGALFLRGFSDWCGTGEEYKLYRLPLGV
jgi:GNAT superfamily N-acetyltransferase